ncbi:D-alanyl-D-alanine endopeptidase [Snodgrassella communis]|uniref:D-alanyl-D-alanine endopeptidase n=1 Tax=Snodgrassella alvi TaxID=1196083 RepID=A0A2N9XI12_9NEIS|nr:D-alanyl-D-alanine endopeptidase [Snodgrassella communis]PIT47967.1 D-alanyl-D-alanine endopeptidase [Snodgrassella alvi]PIT09731.1 D-alanyl-D-alanine endopeptidase [Snodgrassella communis]PIT19859.1 D-alanyl-D-alanine endopeptidase [Snodgrassella communis]PIT22498.1 D-alanyl-D-alanine endopeptidase [Snodgrassella communis]
MRRWQWVSLLSSSLFFAVPTFAGDLDVLGKFIEQKQVGDQSDTLSSFITNHPDANLETRAQIAGPLLSSQSALIMNNETGEILYQKNINQVRSIASISKLVSAMVVLDANQNMNEHITITDAEIDRLKNSTSRLSVGTVMTRRELLHIGLMSSENRAIHALARTYPGGMPAFVDAMNRKVAELGMTNARFYEPTGLDPRNQATARDLALLVRGASQYPLIRQYSTDNSGSVYTSNGRVEQYRNSNALVREGAWPIALQKTGYIREAGRSMVLLTSVQNQPVTIVLLNSPSSTTRVSDARALRSWAMQQSL